MLHIDLDNFKSINDSFGHEVGDQILNAMGKRIVKNLRNNDIVAHLGSDEFCIVFEFPTGSDPIMNIAEGVISRIKEPLKIDENDFVFDCSVGVSIYPDDTSNPLEVLKNADMAKNAAKASEKGTISFYKEGMNEEATKRHLLEQKLRRAIDDNIFTMFYQPRVDVKSGKIIGAEALIRWIEPDNTMIFPDQFIPLAEETGLIQDIDWIVLDSVFRQLKDWMIKGIEIDLSLNLSAKSFSSPDMLIDYLRELLVKYKVPSDHIELEITEGMFLSDVDQAIETMTTLRKIGFKLAVDDFGTGYSSLSYIKKLPVNVLKIDRSFIWDMLESVKDKQIVRSIIDLAHNLELEVIAEGVEHKDHLELLKRYNCEQYQGYYFSKPINVADFESLKEKNNSITS